MRRYACSLMVCLALASLIAQGRTAVSARSAMPRLLAQAQPQSSPQPASDTARIQKENEELRKKLDEYKALEEEIVAQRIAEKARSQVMWWLGFGGLALLVTGALGVKALSDYTRALIAKAVEAMSKARVEAYMLEEGRRQVTAVVEGQKGEFLTFAKQQLAHFVTSTEPVGSNEPVVAGETHAQKKIDYTSEMLPVRSAGEEGSTVGFAFAATLEYQIKKKLGQEVVISPRYIYYLVRKRAGMLNTDSGATMTSVLTALRSTGAIAEDVWPYKPGEYQQEPPEAVQHARHYKIKSSVRVNTVEQIKSALETGGPVVTGITMYRSAFREDVAKTGIIPLPGPQETVAGGHALCLVGYDDDKKLLKAKNDWGAQWGDGGYAYISYAYAEQFLSDTFALTLWLTKADLKD